MINFENVNILWIIFQSFSLPKIKALSADITNPTLVKALLKILSFEKRLEKLAKVRKMLTGHKKRVNSLSTLSNGNIVSASDDCTLKIWDLKSLQCIFTIEDDCMINSVVALNDDMIAYCTYSSIKVQEIKDDYKSFKHIDMGDRRAFNNLLLLPNGKLATYAENKYGPAVVLILDLENDYKIIKSFTYPFQVHCIVNLPNNKFAIGTYYVIRIYDCKILKEVKVLNAHIDWVYSLVYIEKENVLISGSNDKTIKVWDMSEYVCLRTMNGEVEVKCLMSLPNGYFAAAYYDNTVKIWTTYDFECIHTFNLHKQVITSIMLVDDNKLVSASLEKNIIVSKF
jgi:WD40 repeat protein